MCHKVDEICGLEWVKLKSWPSTENYEASPIRTADLFSGCGGLTLGAWEASRIHQRKLLISLAVDHSQEALNVYRGNFCVGERIARNADITAFFPGNVGAPLSEVEESIRVQTGSVDLILAGPPCQGHSDLNNTTRRDDPRNQLYLKVIRAVEIFLPKAVLIENVTAVVHDRSRALERSQRFLRDLGYSISSSILDAFSIGLPQKRKRHLLLGVRNADFDIAQSFNQKKYSTSVLSDYLSGLEDEPDKIEGPFHSPARMNSINKQRATYLFKNDVYDLPNELRPMCHSGKDHSYVSMYGRMRWDRPAQTITSGFGSMGQGRFIHPLRQRTITPHEAARIQGFPDFFDFRKVTKRTALQDMIGNAVPPRIAACLIASLIERGIL